MCCINAVVGTSMMKYSYSNLVYSILYLVHVWSNVLWEQLPQDCRKTAQTDSGSAKKDVISIAES